MYLLIIIFKKSEFMAAQRARPILLNERFLVIIYTFTTSGPLSSRLILEKYVRIPTESTQRGYDITIRDFN